MNTTPVWFDEAPLAASYPKLEQHLECDVLIVGGGIAGVTTAYLMAEAGVNTVLVEKDVIAGVYTGHTTAHVTQVVDEALQDLVQSFGEDGAQLVWDAGRTAIAQISGIVSAEEMDCELRPTDGYMVPSLDLDNPKDESACRDWFVGEYELAAGLCEEEAELITQTPATHGMGVRVLNQAKFHPRKYVLALAEKAAALGARIYEHTDAAEWDEKEHTAQVNGHTVRAKFLVVAAHVPLPSLLGTASANLLQTKLAAYTTYAIGGRLPKGRTPEALYWDRHEPYNYLRVDAQENCDYLIYGGEDHKSGQHIEPAKAYERLEHKLRLLFPEVEVTHHWSGQVIETVDGIPYIGKMGENQFVATGFSGNGMTYGTISAIMAREIFLNGESAWEEIFSVHRKKLGALAEYIRENKDFPLHMAMDRLNARGDLHPEQLKAGEGKVVTIDRHKVAACRGPEGGDPVLLSAVCPHLGCIVAWNPGEQTWDCPCHGSRFTAQGEVIAGPAEKPLERIQAPAASSEAAGQ